MFFLDYVFDYEQECLRIDAPSENMGQWLNEQAQYKAFCKTGKHWEVDRSYFGKGPNLKNKYYVKLKRFDETS